VRRRFDAPRTGAPHAPQEDVMARRAAVAFVAALSFLCSVADAADQVELKNGDRLSGTVVKHTGETLVFTTPYAKEIPIAWAEVQSLTTETPYWVKLGSGEYVSARFVPRDDGVYLESEHVEGSRPVALAEVVTIGIPPGARWSADVKAVVNGSQGNTETFALGAAAEVFRETDDDRLRFGGVLARQSQDEKDTVKNTRGWLYYDYHLGAHWDLGGFLTLEYDRFKDLDLRTVVGAGPGYRFIDTKTMLFKVRAGLAYVNENFGEQSDRDYATAVLADEFRWQISEDRSVYQLLDVYPSLANGSDLLLHAEVGFRQTLMKGLFAELALIDDYDNLPADGRKKNDFRYLVQLGYQL
jgi:putative salt-induced outer membrane protein YdiY